ncbi:MAG: hypothetical protein AVDCRST_MAG08-193, partial [uncultured Acetobacteraceae bacterium]
GPPRSPPNLHHTGLRGRVVAGGPPRAGAGRTREAAAPPLEPLAGPGLPPGAALHARRTDSGREVPRGGL